MIKVLEVDTSRLWVMTRALRNAIIGTGGDASELVKDQSRLLSVECGNQVSPRTQSAGEKKVKKGITSFLYAPTVENIEGSARSGDGMVWMAAGKNFLKGASESDYHGDSWGKADQFLFDARRSGRRAKLTVVGNRGKQVVKIVKGTVVSSISRKEVIARYQQHVGRQKASLMQAAARLGQHGIPQWVLRHIPSRKAILDIGNLNGPSPSVTFGSKAAGITRMRDKIARAVTIRGRKMKIALDGILRGYSADWRAGLAPRRKHHRASH